MGLFNPSSASLPPPKISTDGTPIAPDRSQRAKCWAGRDAFFSCLDEHDIIDSTNITGAAQARSKCQQELAQFEGACASSWVTYFQKRRFFEDQKAKALTKLKAEGAVNVPGELPQPKSPGQ